MPPKVERAAFGRECLARERGYLFDEQLLDVLGFHKVSPRFQQVCLPSTNNKLPTIVYIAREGECPVSSELCRREFKSWRKSE